MGHIMKSHLAISSVIALYYLQKHYLMLSKIMIAVLTTLTYPTQDSSCDLSSCEKEKTNGSLKD